MVINGDSECTIVAASNLGGSVDQTVWLGPMIGDHLVLMLHLSNELGELSL